MNDENKTRQELMAEVQTLRALLKQSQDCPPGRGGLPIDRLPLAYVLFDADGCVLDWNSAAEKMFGYTREEILGRVLFGSVVELPLAEGVQEVLQRLRAGDMEAHSVNENRTKDGRIIICEWFNTPLTDGEGRHVGTISLAQDVTEHKRAAQALRESEERHRLLSELTSDYTYNCRVDPDGAIRIESATSGFRRVTGYTVEEVEAQGGWASFIHPDDLPNPLEHTQHLLAGKKIVNELRIVRKDGHSRWIRYSAHPVWDAEQRCVTRLLGAVQDITERRQAEEVLRQTNQTLQSLIQAVPLAVVALDSQGNVTLWNPGAERIFGWRAEEVVGRALPIVPTDKKDEYQEFRRSELRGEARVASELRRLRKDGTLVDVSLWTAPILDGRGNVCSTIGVLADITARKRTERQLREYAARSQALSRKLLELLEEQQRHLARELHDEIGQGLTGLQLTLGMCRQSNGDRLAESLDEAEGLVKGLTAAVRNLSLQLRPTMLDDLGLLPAVVWHLDRYTSQTGIKVLLEHADLENRLPPAVECAAYRIMQEALTNVARHAHVREATVRIWRDLSNLCLQIEDHGAGFDSVHTRRVPSSSGLSGMQERAALLGGHLTIESSSASGTRVTAELPLNGSEPKAETP
jgi:PAS domain S-box-containing protein